MREYESMHLVKGEDLNHHGTLFAARSASWLVEAGFAAAACTHGNGDEIVLRCLNQLSYVRPVAKGSMVRFTSRVVYVGKSSLMVAVEAADAISGQTAIEGMLTFVTVEAETGRKKYHEVHLDAAEDDREQRQREKAIQIKG